MYAYHVVTDRPLKVGQQIIFDETHHNGVYQRVYDKLNIVKEIYGNPANYNAETLEHHTSVAMRELALEEVRKKKYLEYPLRMSCLYVSRTFRDMTLATPLLHHFLKEPWNDPDELAKNHSEIQSA